MAPIPEAYFPSLDKCFSGDVQLLSWRRAFLYTNDPEGHADNGGNVAAFLSHPESTELLSQSVIPSSSPSAKSKSEFESRTAAIHVETNSKTSFDLKEIKSDAQWLSEKAQIDEIAALRIAVIEWQNRPASRLTTTFSAEEAMSLQSAAGTDNLRVSVAGPNLASVLRQAADKEDAATFDTEVNRRLRLRSLYISERSHILKTYRKLLILSLHGLAGESTNNSINESERTLALRKLGETLFQKNSDGEGLNTLLTDCITGIRNRLRDLESDGGWLGASDSSQETEDIWRTTLVEEIVHILQIMFHRLQASSEIPAADLVISWVKLMAEHSFLEPLQVPCQQPLEVLLPLQAFTSLVTLAFLRFSLAINHILGGNEPTAFPPGQKPYYLSKEAVSQVTEILLGASMNLNLNTVNSAALLWGVVLQAFAEAASISRDRREQEQSNTARAAFLAKTENTGLSRGMEPSLYEDLFDCASMPQHSAEDVIARLCTDELVESVLSVVVTLSIKAGSMSAIDDILTDQWVRLHLFDIIRVAINRVEYTPEILEATLAILTGTPDNLRWDKMTFLGPASDPRSVFASDRRLMAGIFELARSRFPYETVPFLRLCRALVTPHEMSEDGLPLIVEELDNMSTFTQIVSPGFQGYETIREDENANWVSLIQSLPMFQSASRSLHDTQTNNALIVSGSSEIPTSTIGQVISESKPAIIMWQHQYSCLSFLGSWLEEWSASGGYCSDWNAAPCTEIIELLADLVAGARNAQAHDAAGTGATRILEMASDGLSKQGDIISVVLDIFERNLQNIGSRGDPANALDPIMACLRFIQEVIKVLPSRVWPFFSRSSFIGSDGKGGIMTAIVSAMELPSGEYPFLLSCVNLLVAAIDDAASRAVLRKSPGSVAGKSTIASDWTAGIPSHVMRTILLNFTRTMVEIFNSNGNWRFNLPEQQFKLNATLASAFDRILYYAYGVNDSAKPEAKITGVFSDSATYILDLLRPRSSADLPFNPLLRLISDGLQTPPTVHLRYLTLVENQVNATLGLCIKLVQAARLTQQPGSLLEEQLFKATPVLVKLYALHDAYRLPVVSLLEILISVAASDPDNEPPSLVGHLGAEASCLFLDVLSQLDKPLNDEALRLANWKLLSTFVSKRQQWLAVFILTGASPRQTLKKSGKSGDPSMRGVPFLQMALDKLANIEQEEPQMALALLEFVSRAQENWPWATPHLKKHSQFFNSIVSYVSKLKISSLPVIQQIYATRIAAVVADICAVYLHAAKEMGDFSFVKTLIPLVQWYSQDAVEVNAYNSSLHANLKKNFEMRYTGCKVVDFKRTPLVPRALGRDYYYDLGMGEKLLSYDFAWSGSRNRGFSEEFERANINLSLVEAQVTLLHSWKFFAIEHCADFMPDFAIQKSMAVVAQNCLEANTRSVTPEAIFEEIQQVRVDFAQALCQRLVQVDARGAEAFALLEAVYKALRDRHSTYEDALISNDIEYYRSLLNVLFLALQFHLDKPSRTSPETLSKPAKLSNDLTLIVEIVKMVVAQGFKSLTTYLHEEPDNCLQVKNSERLYEHITYHIQDNDVARHATTLFSWADQLAVAGDPIYGDLSVSVLVKLSTLPMLAEHLAVEAVLMRLSTCRLSNGLRQPKGFGPFDAVPRLYTIWTGGFLPLCLNLLYNVIRAAPEVAAFLNQFEGQLSRASECFSVGHPSASAGVSQQWISLSMASEAYSLALISFMLDRFREAGPSAGLDAQSIKELKWDKAQVKEDIEELLGRRSTLRGRIVATTEKEAEWSRQKPLDAASGTENRLEEKVVAELNAAVACLGGEEES
ncbi:hypothetical protein N7526_000539 [Penicillium atrosanguineum]|nr:hypothetical protein N7526_000539 [Penicillium atrosanguineum]